MDPADLITHTATQALERMRRGALSVHAYATALLDHVARGEETLHAWAFLDRDLILHRAALLDANGPHGALFGLPVGVKDVFLTEDMPTQYGAPSHAGHDPRMDAAAVAILRAQGALIFGKTHTVEFGATGRPAPTANPRDPGRTPGGSSSGSAAAVAAGHVPLALATQTAGSVIRPASFCGIHALKPSWGLVSRDGCRPFAPRLDTIGWYGRGVADLALLYGALVPDARRPIAPLLPRIALCRTAEWSHAEANGQAALENAGEQLRRAGCAVTDLTLPAPFAEATRLLSEIMSREGGRTILAESLIHPGTLAPSFAAQLEAAATNPAPLCAAYDAAAALRPRFDAHAAPFDAILTLSAGGVAPRGLANTGDYRFNTLWTLLHTPAVNLPFWHDADGLPVGLTLTGPRFCDPALLAVAARLETLLDSRPTLD
jgi:Asp-tRNA(Asn)/Glu-tRNA(Gln) amidotransferase A subunit family amidase